MKKIYVIIMLALAYPCAGQRKERSEKVQQRLDKADQLVSEGYAEEAIELFQEALAFDDADREIKLKIAEVYLDQKNIKEANHWYKQVFASTDSRLPVGAAPRHLYNYAEMALAAGDLNEALHWFETYRQVNPSDTRSLRKIVGIQSIAQLKKDSYRYAVTDAPFNSPYPDFSPSYYDSGLVFVSGRAEATEKKKADSKQGTFLDLYKVSQQGSASQAEKFSDVINTDFYEGPAVFYDNGRKMIFTRNNLNGKLKSSEERVVIHLQLFSSEKDTATGLWKEPVLLSINNKDYSIGHPAISRDGRYLYFSSNMPGSYGGTDLYVSEWADGNWKKPENLGTSINTEGNEMFPFLQNDTLLYFASNGHAGFGGLDIYHYSLSHQTVVNMGDPVNSSRDDFGFVINPEGTSGYFSSNRKADETGKNDDIYAVAIKQPDPEPVVDPADTAIVIEIYYTVQILALKNPKPVRRSFLKDLKGVLKHDGHDGFHRYTFGHYSTLDEAVQVAEVIKARGYPDAFVRREKRYAELSKRPGVEVYK